MDVESTCDTKSEVKSKEEEKMENAPTKTILEGDMWIKNVSTFLSNHFGTEGVKYLGHSNAMETLTDGKKELQWRIAWDEYDADVYVGEDGKGVRVVSTSADTHKRVTGIMNRVFKTMRPLEETWCLVSK